jgi:CubicO group peptidase (beta-lactamase class C family)
MISIKRLGLAVVFLAAGLAGDAQADQIDDYVKAEMARQRVPGLALAIIQHGHLVRAQGYGFANLEHSVPVHPDTVFKTGAVGMQFTAAATMLLAEDGKLRLDDSVRKFLPEAPPAWAAVTIRNLLNHTSGLPATPAGEFRTDYTDDELLRIIYRQDLNFHAGKRWRFSYTDYIVLGFIIRKVSGEFYGDLLAKRIFAPLGMRTARTIDELAVVPNRAAGYELRDGGPRNAEWVSPTANSTADGSLYLSILDYARWEAAAFDHRVLKPESWAAMGQPAQLATGGNYPYGFGWFVGRSAGQATWWHSGSWQGFKTSVIRYLGDELTVVVFENGEGGDPASIARHVAALVNPTAAPPAGAPIEDRTPEVTDEVKTLLTRIADGTADDRNFTAVSKQDFADMMSEYRASLTSLGSLRQLALFARYERGGDLVRTYRARYDNGVLEVSLGCTPDGRVGSLDIIPAEDWNAPVQD